jgi:ring-1,2-phenylacetyl-CoA epoxidase subunit PaaC
VSADLDSGVAYDSAGVARYAMALGDDALVLAQRCAEWIAAAPVIEEDVAIGNIGLDLLGQARMLLSHAGQLEGLGRTEDDLAYLRDPHEFCNLQLCELPNVDFAVSMARLLVFSSYQLALYRRLERSSDPTIAAVAAKAVKEVAYHREHATLWVLRLGDGTDLSRVRMQAGINRVWPYLAEIFDDSWLEPSLVSAGIAVPPSELAVVVTGYLDRILAEATLSRPQLTSLPGGGRRGLHTEELRQLLTELQSVARAYPGVTW